MADQRLTVPTISWHRLTLFALCSTILLASTRLSAEPIRYVSDLLVVKLHSDVEQASPVVSTVRTGDRLEVIRQHPAGYVKVRTSNDVEGWIADKYLTNDLPKELIISELHKKIADLEQSLERFSASPSPAETTSSGRRLPPEKEVVPQQDQQLRQRLAELNAQVDTLATQNNELSLQLESTRHLPDPDQRARTAALSHENQLLTARLADLNRSRAINGAVAGALVFIAGVIFGSLIVGKKRRLSF
ncbi:MAG: TIGR04211 family SH3 domain-containing protein [Desulfofustis sp.]|nr:TIGR04211 family SH3 domain-containing protein [Desulfofustis sp.]